MGLMNKQTDLIGDVYKAYEKSYEMGKHLEGSGLLWMSKETKETFINKIKTDDEFAKRWGITIETRELSNEEITFEANKRGFNLKGMTISGRLIINPKEVKEHNLPTKLTTITYNGQIQEKYED